MRTLVCALFLAAALPLAAGSSSSDSPAGGTTTHEILIVGHAFSAQYGPPVMVIQAGDAVKWTNMGTGAPHTATAIPPGTWSTGVVTAGTSSAEISFPEPGLQYYFCAIHPSTMKGFVYVV